MAQFVYEGIPDEQRARMRAAQVATIQDVRFDKELGDDRYATNKEKARLAKDIDDGLDAADASMCLRGLTFAKGEPVEVEKPVKSASDEAKSLWKKLRALCDAGVLTCLDDAPKEEEESQEWDPSDDEPKKKKKRGRPRKAQPESDPEE